MIQAINKKRPKPGLFLRPKPETFVDPCQQTCTGHARHSTGMLGAYNVRPLPQQQQGEFAAAPASQYAQGDGGCQFRLAPPPPEQQATASPELGGRGEGLDFLDDLGPFPHTNTPFEGQGVGGAQAAGGEWGPRPETFVDPDQQGGTGYARPSTGMVAAYNVHSPPEQQQQQQGEFAAASPELGGREDFLHSLLFQAGGDFPANVLTAGGPFQLDCLDGLGPFPHANAPLEGQGDGGAQAAGGQANPS